MKLNTKQVRNILTGMNRISEEIKAERLRLETGTSFAVAIAKKKLVPISEAFDEAHQDILDQYVTKDESGQMKKIPAVTDKDGNVVVPEQWDLGVNLPSYQKDVKALYLNETEVERLEPIKLSDFKTKKLKSKSGKKEDEQDSDIDPDILFLLTPWLILED